MCGAVAEAGRQVGEDSSLDHPAGAGSDFLEARGGVGLGHSSQLAVSCPCPAAPRWEFLPGDHRGPSRWGWGGMGEWPGCDSCWPLSPPPGSSALHGSHPYPHCGGGRGEDPTPHPVTHSSLHVPQVPLTEVVEPLDFEEMVNRPLASEPGPLRDLLEFPADDLELLLQPRESRTTEPGIPEDGCVGSGHASRPKSDSSSPGSGCVNGPPSLSLP